MPLRSASRILALALLALAVPLLAAPPAHGANVSCRVAEEGDPGPAHDVLYVRDTSESVTHIYRQGEEIFVSNNADRERAVCAGGIPTVFNIDRIVYSTASGVPFLNYGGDGPLAPGASAELGNAEIEIEVVESYEPKVLNVAAGAGADEVKLGQSRERSIGVDLDAGDPVSRDVDVFAGLKPGERIFLRVVGKGGDDVLSALGAGSGYAFPVTAAERVALAGGDGDDVLAGGPARETLSGNDGDDEMFGGRGPDRLYVGPGRDRAEGGKGDDEIENRSDVGGIDADLLPDRILGGAGDDSISTDRGVAGDRIDCGAGRDDVFKQGGDISLRCERTDFR